MKGIDQRRTISQKIWQVVVGWLLGLFVVNLLGVFLVRFMHIVPGQVGIGHLIHFSPGERIFLTLLPILPAAILARTRPLISIGILLSVAMAWMISGY